MKRNGELVWGRALRTQKEAFEAVQRMRKEFEELSETAELGMTIGEAFDETIQRLLDGGGSQVTADGYRARFDLWEETLDPEALVVEVTVEDIRALVRARRNQHKGKPSRNTRRAETKEADNDGKKRPTEPQNRRVSSNGIRQDLRILHRVLAVGGFPPNKNPARKRTQDDSGGVEWPEEKQPDRPFFTMEQVADIEGRVRKSGRQNAELHADLIVFLAITGLRSFELSRLTAPDFVFEKGRGGGYLKAQGKRGGIRRVAFSKGDEQLVRRLMKRTKAKSEVATPSYLATMLKRWSTRLKVPGLSARALRRTFATDMCEGSDLRTVQTQLGHSQLTTTQKYLGERPELARDAAERRHRRLRGDVT